MSSVTLDTGALIALERRRPRMWKVLQRARELGVVPVVPADVIAEWWRGRSDIREHILASVVVEPLTAGLARLAGECLARVEGASTVDAIVMASAAQRGDAVYTSDVADLERLRAFFPPVRVFAA
ncbi:MAG TPA: PIN domain-containing protein [Polyangiaceae bacterium]